MTPDSFPDGYGLDEGARLAAQRRLEEETARLAAPGPPSLDPPFPYAMESYDPDFHDRDLSS